MRAAAQVAAGFRLQLAISRRTPGQFLVLLTSPLFTVILVSLVLHGGRDDRALVNAVVGAGLIGLWAISLDVAASVLSEDRWYGRLELLLVTPASIEMVVLGRILAVACAGAFTFAESWVVAALCFGVVVPIAQPLLATAALLATTLAATGTATLLAAAFMLSRTMHVYQNAMTYPVYILAGVVVPVAFLPDVLEPLSRVVYLSWGASLLRDSVAGGATDVLGRLGAVLGLGAVALAVAVVVTRRVRERLRHSAAAARA